MDWKRCLMREGWRGIRLSHLSNQVRGHTEEENPAKETEKSAILEWCSSQRVGEPTMSVLPGSFLEMLILRPIPDLLHKEVSLEMGPRSLLTSTSGDSSHSEAKRRKCFIYIKWTVGDDSLFICKNYFIFEHIIFLLEILCTMFISGVLGFVFQYEFRDPKWPAKNYYCWNHR